MMKHARLICLIGILALVLAATAAWAQPGMGPGGGQGRGWGAGDPFSRICPDGKAPSNMAAGWISLFSAWIAMIGAPSICIVGIFFC